MKLNKVSGGEWIDVKDELPEKNKEYPVRIDDYKSVNIFDPATKKFYENDKANNVTHWLKPFTDKYILSEDELKTLLAKYESGLSEHDFYQGESLENATKFFESLTK